MRLAIRDALKLNIADLKEVYEPNIPNKETEKPYAVTVFKDDTKKVGAVQSSLEKHNSQMNTIGLLSYQNLIQINSELPFMPLRKLQSLILQCSEREWDRNYLK